MDMIWILLIVSFASLLKGSTGFGFALVSLPALLFWYPLKELIPTLLLCNFIISVFMILQKKEKSFMLQRLLRVISPTTCTL